MRRVAIVILSVGAVTAAAAVLAHAGSPAPAGRVLPVEGSVDLISMDGPSVAILSTKDGDHDRCVDVRFWNVLDGKVTRVRIAKGDACFSTESANQDVYLGFAGRRAVWTIHPDGGRYPTCAVYTATIDAPRAIGIPECSEDDVTGYGSGEDVGAWAGDGPLLVGNTVWGDPGCDNGCPDSTLVRVRPTRLQELRKGDDTLYVRSVDAGRIVVLRSSEVAVMNSAGHELKVLRFKPKQVEQTALEGNDLAVKKARTLEVYDVRSGKLRKTWKLRPGSALGDVHDGVAMLQRDKRVQLLRLADGHGHAVPAGGFISRSALEAPGLVYAFNPPKGTTGRVVFVPFSTLERALR